MAVDPIGSTDLIWAADFVARRDPLVRVEDAFVALRESEGCLTRRGGAISGVLAGKNTPWGHVVDCLVFDHADDAIALLCDATARHTTVVGDAGGARATEAYAAAGFTRMGSEVLVGRSLAGQLPRVQGLRLVPMASCGPAALLGVLTDALAGAPHYRVVGMDPAALLAHWTTERGSNPRSWAIAHGGDEACGVVLPRVEQRIGSLAFIGLVQAARSRGLGAALHAAALGQLVTLGATAYEDATDVRNIPMQRIFARHSCHVSGRSDTWSSRPGTANAQPSQASTLGPLLL